MKVLSVRGCVIVWHTCQQCPLRKLLVAGCHVILRPNPARMSTVTCSPSAGRQHRSSPGNWTTTRRPVVPPSEVLPSSSLQAEEPEESAGEERRPAGSNMRSVAGLAAIVAAASFYLYLLSTHLPPGLEHVQPGSEGQDEAVQEYRCGREQRHTDSMSKLSLLSV